MSEASVPLPSKANVYRTNNKKSSISVISTDFQGGGPPRIFKDIDHSDAKCYQILDLLGSGRYFQGGSIFH